MIYIKSTALHKCLISSPEDSLTKNPSRLVVGLHGGGSNPDKLINLWEPIPNRGFMYAVPQAPYPLVVDAELMFDWALWPSRNRALISKATALSEAYIVSVIQELSDRYNIDEVYLLGFSQGAIFTYLVGIKQHQLFSGIICMSGPGLLRPLKNPYASSPGADWLPEKFIRHAAGLRVFITHGKEDQAANYALGIQSREILLKHGCEVTFRNFVGGHQHPPKEVLREIANWLRVSSLQV